MITISPYSQEILHPKFRYYSQVQRVRWTLGTVALHQSWSQKLADDKSETGPADSSRINIHEDYEIRYESQKFGVKKSNW
jgi:hypothetical protein